MNNVVGRQCNMSGFFDIQTPKQHVGSNLVMSFYLTDLRGKTT